MFQQVLRGRVGANTPMCLQEGVHKTCLWWSFREQGRKDGRAASTGGSWNEGLGLLKDASSLE